MKNLFAILIILVLAFPLKAQKGRGDIRQGNRYFNSKKFEDSEVAYRKAMEEKGVSKIAEFNLGDALYKQKKFEEAGRQFEAAASSDAIRTNSAKAYHNLGNSMLQAGKIDESIGAYKDALRRNPADLDTKYNLSYAQMMKKKQEKEKNDKSDKNGKSSENDKKDQEQKDQQQQQDQKDPKDQKADQQQANPQNVKISKEDAKRLLEALATDEKKVQEKVKKEKANASKVRTIKDW
ncbi:MAG: tetratricopeptide repeat protein [Bacteroidales bacterium]|jgi:tetratricopeptide (TPR) repeat protein